ncbi:hypothetical protein ACFRQM_13390 [Streptomyces sp. NPDC056831]|uniref:hypothetical protein n=1 Tax=Streptomyces sp. NPDC056831 TaxID=3345954 RepID=UPI0036C51529
MVTRSTVVTAALAAAAALAATGITYASAASTEPAQAAPVVQQQAAAPVSALNGGESGNGNEGKGNEGNEGRGGGYENKGGGRENKGHREHFRGRIQINERTYTAEGGGCITVVSGLGSKTLNIRNESRRTVEVFRGATCDNGAPLATVGPWSSSDGVHPGRVKGGVKVHNGVVGSFRVIERHHGGGKGGDFGEGGDFGDDY